MAMVGDGRGDVARSVAVIGAGACGIVAIKVLRDAGLEVTGFELGSEVGGLWVYQNDNGLAAAYRSLRSNTTGASMAFTDLPMRPDLPDYPSRAHVAAYLNEYADRFDVRPHIRFRSKVVSIEPVGPHWDMVVDTPSGTSTERFDAVVVANGHHWDPQWPSPPYPGSFTGRELHSHDYMEPSSFVGRRVLIVGMGNSAMDIAVELSVVAEETWISARNGTHILPKYLFGRPLSAVTKPLNRLPWRLRGAVLAQILRIVRGPYSRYGLQEPSRGIYGSHPTLSDTLLTRLAHAEINAKPGIVSLDGEIVRFVDGTSIAVDDIIWATGYKVTLPFLDQHIVPVQNNQIALYKRVFPIGVAGLAFVGLVQQRGAMMPIAEEQSRLVADQLSGRYQLPSAAAMEADIRGYDAEISRRYLGTQRHTMEVEQVPYIQMLRRERERGQRRRPAADRAMLSTAA